jgi:ATP-binding cassette subfamily F protein 3
MIAVNIDKVAFTYFSEPIFTELSWEVHDDRVVGLVGPNGCGKSTLLKLINRDLVPDSGFISRKQSLSTGYLPQEPELNLNKTVWDEVTSSHDNLNQIEQELKDVEIKLGEPDIYNHPNKLAAIIDKQSRLIEAFNSLGGPGFEGHVKSILEQVGFKSEDFTQEIGNLSGGQKKLVGLAKLLITKPELLLLDEPDNHLDIAGKDFLLNLIRNYQGAVIIVSHDRYLLDLAVDEIADLDQGKLKVYLGNYSEFSVEKENFEARQLQLYQAQQKDITRLEQSAKRLLSWGQIYDNEKFIKRGKNILKRIDRIEKIDQPLIDRDKMGLELAGWRGSSKVLEINGLDKIFGSTNRKGLNDHLRKQENRIIFKDLDCLVWHGERIGLIGPNGSGKSLLFQMILGNEEPTKGTITFGPSIKIGYYAQEHQTLDYEQTLIETVRNAAPISETGAVAFLGRFMFDYDKARDKVQSLSGGERSRLQMALLMLSGANFLLLDEPTNNLDIQSAEVLEEAMIQHEGSILVISHDRYFLDRVANKIIEIKNGTLISYSGNYSDYQRQKNKKPRFHG